MRSKTLALVSTSRTPSRSIRPLGEPTAPDTAGPADQSPKPPAHLSTVLSSPDPAALLPQWRSDELLAGGDEALISHGDQVYRLRRTTTGKLILTK